ncbi:reverse transcriptase family protein [Planctomycetota bacterium]
MATDFRGRPMGLFDFFKKDSGKDSGYDVVELARRLGLLEPELRAVKPAYTKFSIAKKSGGKRIIHAPSAELKGIQRKILYRLLARLKCYPAAMGFEKNKSIATNAKYHVGKKVVIRMDIKDFFHTTSAERIMKYFTAAGWNREASQLLVSLCTYKDSLPQGAPTSPRLSNLVNYNLDAQLTGIAYTVGGQYTRYADDITFSFDQEKRPVTGYVIGGTKTILQRFGYQLHLKKKLHIRRRHRRQQVTGVVVNEKLNLPRTTRRWLRAVEHRLQTGGNATLTRQQLASWRALENMIKREAD